MRLSKQETSQYSQPIPEETSTIEQENHPSRQLLKVAEVVKTELGNVDPNQLHLDAYKTVNEVQYKMHKLTQILDIWKEQQNNDRDMRKTISYWILGILGVEVLAANVAMFCLGFGFMTISDPWLTKIFFTAVFAQVVAILMFVIKNLFPERKSDNLDDVTKMVSKL